MSNNWYIDVKRGGCKAINLDYFYKVQVVCHEDGTGDIVGYSSPANYRQKEVIQEFPSCELAKEGFMANRYKIDGRKNW